MTNPEFIETTIRFASMRQIHSAIDHLYNGDFECAITLANAGEGILHLSDKPRLRRTVEEFCARSAHGKETRLDAVINWLKQGKVDCEIVEHAIISEFEVMVTIYRAIIKFSLAYDDQSPQMIGFKNWAATRPWNNKSSIKCEFSREHRLGEAW